MHIDYDGSTNYEGRLIARGNTANTTRGQISLQVSAANPSEASTLTALSIDSSGNVSVTGGSVGSISDERLKNNVTALPSMIEKVKQLNPVEFDWKEPIVNEDSTKTTNHDIGFIAQQIETVFPDLVYTGGETDDDMPDNLKLISYASLIPVLTKAIQELEARITALEG
jgi:hypothetical protein